jgi:hypothetical protein
MRPSGEPIDAYWANAQNRAPATLVWVVAESAGIIAVVGYLMTGNSVPLAAGLLAAAVLIALRPARLAGE